MDTASNITIRRAAASTALTAAGTGDNTQIVGDIFDRGAAMNFPKSLTIAIEYTTTLAANKTLTAKSLIIEHGNDSGLSDVATYYAPADVVLATDAGSGGTLKGSAKYSVDLHGAKQYVRLKYTPDLNASGTDTATVEAQLLFGDSYIKPAVA